MRSYSKFCSIHKQNSHHETIRRKSESAHCWQLKPQHSLHSVIILLPNSNYWHCREREGWRMQQMTKKGWNKTQKKSVSIRLKVTLRHQSMNQLVHKICDINKWMCWKLCSKLFWPVWWHWEKQEWIIHWMISNGWWIMFVWSNRDLNYFSNQAPSPYYMESVNSSCFFTSAASVWLHTSSTPLSTEWMPP